MNQVLHTTSCTGCHARKASHPVWDCSANQILTKRFCKTAAVSLQHVIVPSQPLLGHHLLHKALHFVFGVTGVAHGDGAAVDVNLMLPGFLAFNALLAEVPLLAMHLHPCVKGTADVQNVLGDVVTLQPLLVQVVDVQENLSCQFFFSESLPSKKTLWLREIVMPKESRTCQIFGRNKSAMVVDVKSQPLEVFPLRRLNTKKEPDCGPRETVALPKTSPSTSYSSCSSRQRHG